MTANDLLRRYVEMRAAQNRYFKERSKGNLIASKAMEAALDRDVQAFLGQAAKEAQQPVQTTLTMPAKG